MAAQTHKTPKPIHDLDPGVDFGLRPIDIPGDCHYVLREFGRGRGHRARLLVFSLPRGLI
jgi:hypothetical protein